MTGFAVLLDAPSSLGALVVRTNAPDRLTTHRDVIMAQAGWGRGAQGSILTRRCRGIEQEHLLFEPLKGCRGNTLEVWMQNVTTNSNISGITPTDTINRGINRHRINEIIAVVASLVDRPTPLQRVLRAAKARSNLWRAHTRGSRRAVITVSGITPNMGQRVNTKAIITI